MGKRMKDLASKVDKTMVYSIDDAIALVKETSTTKFDSSIEVHVRLGINPKKSDQLVRATVVLPNGTGKTKKVAAFVSANHEQDAKDAGADFIYGEEEIAAIKNTGKIDFDVAVATPDMMPKLAQAARVLGPRGLMPNPKTDTVGTNVKKMIEDLKKGKASFKNDDTGNIHQVIGKASFDDAKIKENLLAFLEAVKKAKPSSAKGAYVKGLVLASTMGPGVKMERPF